MDYFRIVEVGATFFYLVGLAMVFQKADEPWLYAIIPIINMITLIRIAGQPWWVILALLIPFVNIYAYWMIVSGLGDGFSKGLGFKIGLMFLPPIFMPWLGFDKSSYRG